VDVHAKLRHLVQREIHVWLAGELALHFDGESTFDQRRDGQQAGQVLAGNGAGDAYRTAQRAAATHGDRQVAVARGIERRAHRAQGVGEILVGPFLHRDVAVYRGDIRPQRRECQHETRGDRALADVEFDAPGAELAAAARDLHRAFLRVVDADVEPAQAVLHAPV